MKKLLLLAVITGLFVRCALAESAEEGFTSLFDGKTFNGWKLATENTNTWTLKDGALVAQGERCHIFYVGDEKPFKNFELRVDVMTATNSNGGIYFHTKYQETGWPKYGFEAQVNNTHGDWKKTGSLYDVVNVKESAAQDNKWWTETIIVKDKHVTIKIDDKVVVEYEEPADQKAGPERTRKIDEGTFALQGHDPKSIVHYKNIRVKRLD